MYLSEASLFSSNANLYATTACEKRQSVQLIGESQGLTSKLFLSLISCTLLPVFPASHRKRFICSGRRGDTQAQGSAFISLVPLKILLQAGWLKTAAIPSLTVPETTVLKPRWWQACAPPKGPQIDSVLFFFQLLVSVSITPD